MRTTFLLCFCIVGALCWAPPRFLGGIVPSQRPPNSQCKTLFTRPDFQFPRDLGRHTDRELDLWWFLAHATDTATGRRFGVEYAIYRVDMTQMCTDENTVVYAMSLGIADVSEDRYRYSVSPTIGQFIQSNKPEDPTFFLRAPGTWDFGQTGDIVTAYGHGVDKATGDKLVFNATVKDVHGVQLMAQEGFEVGSSDPAGLSHLEQVRLDGHGYLTIGKTTYSVQLEAFIQHMSHSHFQVHPVPGGWDWRYVQMSNGWVISCTHYRQDFERFTNYSYCNCIMPQPSGPPANLYLPADKWTMARSIPWVSPRTNTTYFMRHDLTFHSLDLKLSWRTLIDDNELTGGPTYYEGAADVTGTLKGAPITGRGFSEGVGYSSV